MTKTTTLAAAAVAALALPVGASAAKPEKPAKAAKPAKTQKVGFSLTGLATAAPVANQDLTLDVTKGNPHALAALAIKKADVSKVDSTLVDDADDKFTVVFEDGVTAETFNATTDRIKVIGKVERTRVAKAKKADRFTYGKIDVRKVVVSRPGADD